MRFRCKKASEIKWFLFVLPAITFYLVFFILPSISSVYYSFTDWNGITAHFIGFYNYSKVYHDTKVLASIFNSATYSIAIVLVQNAAGLALAVFMAKKFRSVSALRMLFFMPAIISGLAIGFVWRFILEPNTGALNSILGYLHMGFLQQDWLGNAIWGKMMIILLSVWQWTGGNMVIYIAGLQAIPTELYEAGDMDGARKFSRFRHITFPLIAPALTINILLNTIGTLKIFDQIFALTNGGPGYATDSVATMIYKIGFSDNDWGYGTAMSILLFIVILIITAVQSIYLRRREVEM